MPDDGISWNRWVDMVVRELNGIRTDLNKHLDHHREDISDLRDKIDSLKTQISELIRSIESNQNSIESNQNLAIQKLQLELQAISKEEGGRAGASVAKEQSARYSMIMSAVCIAVYQIAQYYLSTLS